MADYLQKGFLLQDGPLPIPSLPYSRTKPTVAYFSGSPGGTFSFEKWQMWRGIAEAAKECGLNLVYIAGDEFESSPQAVLYQLAGAQNVDGIIFWNSFFSPRSSIESIQEFIQHYQPLTVVSIELALQGCMNLMIDNIQGVRDSLAHLIDVHGYRRIAFLTGENSYVAHSREIAFRHILSEEYDLFHPDLVGTLKDLDARGLRPGIDYQAIISHTDFDAIQAMESFQARGLHVPDDVAISGFNDGLEARGANPPLTSVRLPYRNLGRRAVEIIAGRLRGEPLEEQQVMPLQLILRRSCGCLEPLAEKAALGQPIQAGLSLRQILTGQRQTILLEMAQGMGTPMENMAAAWSERLLETFCDELNLHLDGGATVPSAEYLQRLNQILRDALEEGANVSRWHDAISTLRRCLRPGLNGPALDFAEDLWQQARVLVGQAAVRVETHRAWQTSRRAEILRDIESGLLTAVDFEELLTVLTGGLPRLGVSNFYLVLYEDGPRPDGWARLMFAYQDGRCCTIDAGSQRFQTRELLPPGWLPRHAYPSLVIEALHLREEQIGYILFETEPPADASSCEIYQALRLQLSSALKEVRLRQKLQDAVQQAEEANLLKSRFLSMVSHELRTPLNLIVGLSEMSMRQQNRGRKASLDVLRHFNEQIYVSGQHLDRLIRDVLDLASSQAGQMNLIVTQLDLVPVLKDVTCIGQQLADQKNLRFRAEYPAHLPPISGDKTRLRQVLLNLISNAIKFTAHGEVALTVQEAADELLISVKDTGLGIAKEEQERIFDEFHQSDRTVVRGYGGIGLGLAITRRLVEMHGGRIWVTSTGQEDSGSNFCFTLPVLPPEACECEDRIENSPSSREGMVLVLTKTTGGAQKLIERLSHHGFAVEEMAIDGYPGFIEDLVTSPPGAVILDLAPASEQGWEIIKWFKETPVTQDVPVLFYSLMDEGDSGSVFEMDFLSKPVGAEQLVKALQRHGVKTSGSKEPRKILIIDDEPGILDLHARMVSSELPEIQLLTALGGRQGLEMMRRESPDLVLLDLMMPELDGFGVLKIMQEEQMLRNIPVIILSAQVLTRREMARLNQGVAAVLGKGLFSARETISRIECVLSRSKRLGSDTQRLVHHAMAYIHEHYREPISRSDIASHLNVNEQYLSRCFNKETGIGPMAYLSRYRIQQAKRLLEMGTMSITQVALDVGLSSQSYFSRIFQQETGITPSAYQRGEHSKA